MGKQYEHLSSNKKLKSMNRLAFMHISNISNITPQASLERILDIEQLEINIIKTGFAVPG